MLPSHHQEGVQILDEILSGVFDLSSQTIILEQSCKCLAPQGSLPSFSSHKNKFKNNISSYFGHNTAA